MDLDILIKKLIHAGRQPPAGETPYAFEKRVMHAIKGLRPMDHWTVWSRALWRAAAPCVAVMLLLGIWTTFLMDSPYPGTLSEEMEATLLTSLDQQLEENTW